METVTAAGLSPAVSYTPNRILGIMLRDHSANGAGAAPGEAEEQAAGTEK